MWYCVCYAQLSFQKVANLRFFTSSAHKLSDARVLSFPHKGKIIKNEMTVRPQVGYLPNNMIQLRAVLATSFITRTLGVLVSTRKGINTVSELKLINYTLSDF